MTESRTTVADLPELINSARAGFTAEARLRWYPKLPKIVTGKFMNNVLVSRLLDIIFYLTISCL